MKPKLALSLFLLVVFTLGCAAKRTMVGTWDMPIPPSFGIQGGTLKVTFAENNTLEGNGEYEGIKLKLPGTYEMKDNALTVTFTDLNLDTTNAKIPDLLINMGKERVKGELNKPISGKVEWKNDNEVLFTTTQGGPAITLKRVGAGS